MSLTSLAIFLLDPLKQTLLLLITGILGCIYRQSYKNGFGKLIVAAFIWLAICSQTWFSHLVMAPLENYSTKLQAAEFPDDEQARIHVLACYFRDKPERPEVEQWTECSLRRLTQAAILSKKENFDIIVTGGNFIAKASIPYAEAAERYLLSLGVKKERIITIVNEGSNTRAEISAIKDQKFTDLPIVAISDTSHTKRLEYIYRNLGMRNLLFHSVSYQNGDLEFPDLLEIDTYNLNRTARAFYEYGAMVKAHLGW